MPTEPTDSERLRREEGVACRGLLVLPHATGPDIADPIVVARRKLAEDFEAIAVWLRREGERCAGIDHQLVDGADRIAALGREVGP